jgi:3-hydroxyisobutyrate dehydrogenase
MASTPARALGLLYVDAPSGGAPRLRRADDGRGRGDAARAKAEPCLNAMAAKVYRLGDCAGNGSKVKIINQLSPGISPPPPGDALGLREGVGGALTTSSCTAPATAGCSRTDGTCWPTTTRRLGVDIFVRTSAGARHRQHQCFLPLASTAHRCSCRLDRRLRQGRRCRGDQDLPGIELPGAKNELQRHRAVRASALGGRVAAQAAGAR